jgi:hypothetical protein
MILCALLPVWHHLVPWPLPPRSTQPYCVTGCTTTTSQPFFQYHLLKSSLASWRYQTITDHYLGQEFLGSLCKQSCIKRPLLGVQEMPRSQTTLTEGSICTLISTHLRAKDTLKERLKFYKPGGIMESLARLKEARKIEVCPLWGQIASSGEARLGLMTAGVNHGFSQGQLAIYTKALFCVSKVPQLRPSATLTLYPSPSLYLGIVNR